MVTPTLALATLLAGSFADLTDKVDPLPSGLALQGKPVAVRRWTDKLGVNLLVLTETPRVGEASGGTKRLFGHHFVSEPKGWRQIWRITDAVTDCEFDLTLELVPASVTVTDLDADGTAETAFAYVATCTSDVSPSQLKVLMHEGPTKLALRGTTRVQVGVSDDGKKEFTGGERKPDAAFARAPKAFLAHAQKLFDAAGGK